MKSHFVEDKELTIEGKLVCHKARDHSFGHKFKSDITKESMK